MKREKQFSAAKVSEPEISYFGLQAYMGTTKHMGGFETTKELIELCRVNEATYVLDVGCGVGATACYLAKRYGCEVRGVDVHEGMIARSNKRAKKEGVEERVEFRVADAQRLPFEDALFDVVICESVATFVEDKQRMAAECARVTRPGGYVGFNEEIWIKTPPPEELIEFVRRTWDIESDVPTRDVWVGVLQAAGLKDIVARVYEFDARRESSQVKRYRLGDFWGMFYRTLCLYVKSSPFREYMKGRYRTPKSLFDYLGYGIFVGRR